MLSEGHLKDIIRLELSTDIYVTPNTWVPSLYHDLLDEAEIQSYLEARGSGYRNGRWIGLAKSPKGRSALYKPILALVNRILVKFGGHEEAGVTRKAFDTRKVRMGNGSHGKALPDISIRATGPSFERPPKLSTAGIGLQDIASGFNVILDKDSDQQLDQVVQFGIYCRQILIQQPNRNFVRFLIITQSSVRLVHYDRSGTYVTPFHNIHEDPVTFIRLILGLSSTNESILGFDTAFEWTLDPESGRKVAGTIATLDEAGGLIRYKLNMDAPPLVRAGIRGRGTTCWTAFHPETGDRVLIKDAWRNESKGSEIEYLKVAKGVEGVVQMISFEDYRAETKDYRPSTCDHPGSYNRIKSRVVMEHYGPSIWNFESRIQLIGAIKDAIQAHKKLYNRLVLHRDISMQNFLLGSSVEPGRRGVIIDLDMAVKIDRPASEIPADPRTGTRQYQSFAVLESSTGVQPPPPQDHLDDIESFFYVTCHIVVLFDRPGVPKEDIPKFLTKWGLAKEADAGVWKFLFVNKPLETSLISKYWGKPIVELVQSFKKFIADIHREKDQYSADARTSAKLVKRLKKNLWNKAAEHYAEVDGFFQTCLDALELEEINGPASETPDSSAPSSPESSPTSPLPECSDLTGGLKRAPSFSEETMDDSDLPRKRPRKS
ncbi:hypothetical protein DFP72DRAFT_256111 [Ephemerocybe angulata]|uniref:Fungal-type protein kinase domain-containing protein n=1 Tax=Ephemerocybe angulata TaxID=980116 RepID=A0A8H6H8T6_9AGAR|nr:hypothetical protein DFP72DRAFT_256111 [Tulosesus angulatus]